MDNYLLIKDVSVVYPDKTENGKSVLVKNGRIADTDFSGELPENATLYNGNGGYLLAGFVDLHVHGGGGADFMDLSVEDYQTVAKTHAHHGTTMLLPTAMAATYEDLVKFISVFKEYKKTPHSGARLHALHLEGPYFSGATGKSVGAQNSSLLRYPDEKEIDALLKVADGDIIRWDAAPELPGFDMFARKMRENGIIASVAHSAATSEQALAAFEQGFSHVTHFYNAVTTYHKPAQKVLAGVVEAAYLTENVSVELIGDGCHIPRDVLRLALKIKGPHRVSMITDAMRIAGTDLTHGKLGSNKTGTDVIVDDGVAKLKDLSSFAGSIATMDRVIRVLCQDYGVSINTASVMMSLTPARLIGVDNRFGSIAVGKTADLVLMDTHLQIKQVFIGGEKIN